MGRGESIDSLLYKEDVTRKAAIPVLSEERLRRQPALGSQTVITSKGKDFDTSVVAACCHSLTCIYFFFHIFEWRLRKIIAMSFVK